MEVIGNHMQRVGKACQNYLLPPPPPPLMGQTGGIKSQMLIFLAFILSIAFKAFECIVVNRKT